MNSAKRREIMAYHEAAHAVVARKLGLSCIAIAMFPTTEGSGKGAAMTRSAAYFAGESIEEQIAGLREDALVALAGPIANVRYSGNAKKFFEGASDDFAHAQSSAVKIALLNAGYSLPRQHDDFHVEVRPADVDEANSILISFKSEVETLVDENWPSIERVARKLSTSDLLSETDIDHLMNEPQSAQLPFMITNAQKQRLRDLGYDNEAISNMTPADAHAKLGVKAALK